MEDESKLLGKGGRVEEAGMKGGDKEGKGARGEQSGVGRKSA